MFADYEISVVKIVNTMLGVNTINTA